MISTQTKVSTFKELYQQDFYLWLEETLQHLKTGNLTKLDLVNLIDEIEGMGNSEKQSIESNLEVVLMHLIKYKYQSEKRTNSWRFTILENRRRLLKAFKLSPSLKRHFLQEFEEFYKGARELASVETGISITYFPVNSPFSPEQVLDNSYLPED
jgi:Domain of unknown function DUF29